MIRPVLLTTVLACLGLAACNNAMPGPNAPATTSARASSQGMPQPANSLPDGARVNSPIAPSTGAVGTTRITPAR